jgi:hypothetical protein
LIGPSADPSCSLLLLVSVFPRQLQQFSCTCRPTLTVAPCTAAPSASCCNRSTVHYHHYIQFVQANTNSGTTYCSTIRIMLQQKHGALSPLHTICTSLAMFAVYCLVAMFYPLKANPKLTSPRGRRWQQLQCRSLPRRGNYFFLMARQPQVGQAFLIVEASRSHSDTPHSV